jgi:NAD(P)-dependent dehydrogenase (short-subunit alcohol dehydrogenase family)
VPHLGHREDALELCREIEAKGRRAFLVHLDQTDPASCSAAVEETVHSVASIS